MFVDEVDIHVQAGDGGNGCLAFRREMRVPRGGPSGGDGGARRLDLSSSPARITTRSSPTDSIPSSKPSAASTGSARTAPATTARTSSSRCRRGPWSTRSNDGDLIPLADLSAVGDRVLVARGGRGGRGNAAFATATNRAPRQHRAGIARRGRVAAAAAEAAGRRRARRLSERRQEHAHLAHLSRAPEDRRLPVHDADARISASSI